MTAVDQRAAPDTGGDAPRPKVARWVALGVGVVLVLFIALLATRPQDSDPPSAALLGKRVPALSGATLDGRTASVDALRGKWVLVNFVAEWCVACVDEHPDLKAFAEANRADVQVLGVAYQSHSLDQLRDFFAKNGGDWPVITSDDGRAALDFGVTAVPETFLVTPDGVVYAHAEGVTREWLDEVFTQGKAALAAQSPSQSTPSSMAPGPR